jgi:endonuclease-3
MGDFHKKPAVVADTHVIRISNLLGLVKTKDPEKVEYALKEIIPKSQQLDFCHRLVHHGREICIARRPKCDICPISNYCAYYKNKTANLN